MYTIYININFSFRGRKYGEKKMDISQKEFEENYILGDMLGSGSFGSVFVDKGTLDGRKYAVKKIPLPDDQDIRKRLLREKETMSKIMHENIVDCFAVSTITERNHGVTVPETMTSDAKKALALLTWMGGGDHSKSFGGWGIFFAIRGKQGCGFFKTQKNTLCPCIAPP